MGGAAVTVPLGFELFVKDRNAEAGFRKIGQAAVDTADKVDGLSKRTDTAAKRQRASWDTVGRASGIAAAGGALALGALVSAAGKFDKAMSGVGAVSNASAADLTRLRNAALKAGADTAFSASQAADAEAELAKAGVSTTDILGGGLTGALSLAAAGQLDLADAATISAQAMNIFKLHGSDVGHIADVLAAGANKSAADVSQLGFALRSGGGAAAGMGLSLEDTIGALSAFADNALVGQDAGTSLKSMMVALSAPSSRASKMMDAVGLSAFDASGQFVGLQNFAGQLQTKLGKLSDESRNAALATIFGTDAMRAAKVFYDIGAKGVTDYTKAVNDQGAASRMAAAQMDNLAGDLEQLKGSIETTLIKGGSTATGVLRGMTKTATGFVNVLGEAPPAAQGTAVALLAIGTTGAGALAVIGSLVPKISDARAALVGMGRGGEIANTALGKVGKTMAVGGVLALGLEAVSFGIGKLQDAMVRTAPGVDTLTSKLLQMRSWSDVAKELGGNAEDLGLNIREIVDPSTTQHINNFFAGVIGQAPKSLREAKEAVGGLDAALTQLVQQGQTAEAGRQFNLIAQAAVAGGASVDQVRKALPGYTNALAGMSNQSKLAAASQDQHKKAADGATISLDKEKTAAESLKDILDALNGNAIAAGEAEIAFSQSLLTLTSNVKDNGRHLDENKVKTLAAKKATLDNRDAVLSAIKAASLHAQAVADESGSVAKGTKTFNDHIGSLRRTLIQSGYTRAEVDKLLASYAKTPKAKPTKMSAPGAVTAKKQVDDLDAGIKAIPGQKTIKLNVVMYGTTSTSKASASIRGGGVFGAAVGGTVPGVYSTSDSDHVPAMLTPKEEVISVRGAERARRQAPGLLEAINAGTVDYRRLDIGGDPGTLRLAYGHSLRLAGGGSIPEVQSRIRGTTGHPYIWGAAGPGGYDCSGLVSAAYGALTGKGGFGGQRYFTTDTIGGSQGFQPGTGAFTVGVSAGRGHMAGNLAGLKFEARSTASGLHIGSSALDVRSFARQFYLPQIGGVFQSTPGPPEIPQAIQMRVLQALRPRVEGELLQKLHLTRRDTGGLLSEGQAAVNVAGGRERVLSAEQNRLWEQGGVTPKSLREALEGMTLMLRDPMGRAVAGQLVQAGQRGAR